MIKLKTLNTPIRFECPSGGQDGYGQPAAWQTIGPEVVLCEWKNAHGAEVWQAMAIQAKEPATLRMWFFDGITPDCRVVRLIDNQVYNIVSVDNVENRNQIMELKVQRWSGGNGG